MDKNLIRHRSVVRARKIKRIRARVSGVPERPRLAVTRTDKHIYAQVIDDTTGKSLVQVTSRCKAIAGQRDGKKKSDLSRIVGVEVAKRCLEQGIQTVAFDRRGFLYHGRIKALADGARSGGLKF